MGIDKPIAAKIIFKLKDSSINHGDFIGFSTSLYHKNLIFDEPRELRINYNQLELSIIFRDLYSFKHWNKILDADNVSKISEKLLEAPLVIEEKNVIIEVDEIKNCNCQNTEFYILQGRSLQFSDELICNNCLGHISYSKIPLEIEIESWQRYYQRFYLNWLESGVFEKTALKELTSYKKSILNLEGEKIRKQLSNYFQLPVYFHLFSEESSKQNSCIRCENICIASNLLYPNRICSSCFACFGEENRTI